MDPKPWESFVPKQSYTGPWAGVAVFALILAFIAFLIAEFHG